MTRWSLTGWFIQLRGSPLSWKTKKHNVVSCSSAEIEYRVMADIVSEILLLRELLPALGIAIIAPIPLHSDSLSAISIAANLILHAWTKHVGLDFYSLRDKIIRRTTVTKHISTTTQLADIMIKALDRKELKAFFLKMSFCNLHTLP